jgi:MerC mercury resistance protein
LNKIVGAAAQQDDVFHRYMAVLVTLPVLLALVPGFLAHRRWVVPALGGFGLACFITAVLVVGPRFGETAETVLAVIGGAHLVIAHLKNRSFCRSCVTGCGLDICSTSICNTVAQKGIHGN